MIHFTVITVVKNDLVGLRKSRNSLNQQQFKNWTHLIIDGSSKDGTLKYIKSLPKENTIYVSESDTGVYNAMNKAWKMSDPESYMFYLNARDVFTDPTSLYEAAKALKLSPGSNWGCTTHEEINEDGGGWVCKLVSPPSIPNQLYAYGYRSHQAVVMKTSFIQSLGGFDETYKIASDWDLIAKAINKEVPLVWTHPIVRFELGGMSSSRLLEAHMELREIRKKYFGKSLKWRFMDTIWCAIYLKYFGYKSNWHLVPNFLSRKKNVSKIRKRNLPRIFDYGILGFKVSIVIKRARPKTKKRRAPRRTPIRIGLILQVHKLLKISQYSINPELSRDRLGK
jgi:glycosyltransferase involved in cell wall biosynthesis